MNKRMNEMKVIMNKRIDDGTGTSEYIHSTTDCYACHCCKMPSLTYCMIPVNVDKVALCKSCLNEAISVIDKAIIENIK